MPVWGSRSVRTEFRQSGRYKIPDHPNWVKAASACVLVAVYLAGSFPSAWAQEGSFEHLRFGLNAYRDGFYAPAIKSLQLYLAQNPQGEKAATARFFVAQAFRLSGMDKDAATSYRAFLSLYGKDKRSDEARMRLGALMEKAGNRVGAAKVYGEVGAGAFRAETAYRLASLRLAAGKWKEAEAALSEFLRLAPDDPRAEVASYERGHVLDRLKRPRDALSAYRIALKRYPKSARGRVARRRMGLLLYGIRQYREAETVLSEYLTGAPSDSGKAELLLALAASRYALGRYSLAASDFEKSLSLPLREKEISIAEKGVAVSWWAAADYKQAREAYRRLLRRPDEANLTRFLQSIELSGGCKKEGSADLGLVRRVMEKGTKLRIEEQLRLARCLETAGLEQEALEGFKSVARVGRESLAGILGELRVAEMFDAGGNKKEAVLRYERAVSAALRLKRAKKKGSSKLEDVLYPGVLRAAAIRYEMDDCPAALRLVKMVPGEAVPEKIRAEVASLRAECALRAGSKEKAELYFGQVLLGARRPELAARARFQFASLAEKRGDKEEALRRWEDAIPLLPREMALTARLRAGRLRRVSGDLKGARALLLPFAQEEKADLENRRKVWLLLARDAASASEWTVAEEALANWDALTPQQPLEGLRLWASVRFNRGDCPLALQAARRALDEGPEKKVRLDLERLIASCLLKEEKFDEATAILRGIVEREPNVPAAWLSLGGALDRAGASMEAAEVYGSFAERFPNHSRTHEIALRTALLRNKAGDRNAALAAYRIASKSSDPLVAEPALYEIARDLETRGRVKEALAAYVALAGIEPRKSKWRRAAVLHVAGTYGKRGEWEKALKQYRRIAVRDGKSDAEAPSQQQGPSSKPKAVSSEAKIAEKRIRELESYERTLQARREKIKRLEPLVR